MFFTDVTESYRLSRSARVRTDLGGFYFHLFYGTALIALAALTGQQFLLLPALLINIDILRQCLPFVRLDGYWVLSDLTGVPDIFTHIGPRLRRLLRRDGATEAASPQLRPWASRALTVYTALVVPVLLGLLVLIVIRLPVVLRMGAEAAANQWQLARVAFEEGDAVVGVAALLQILLLALVPVGSLFVIALTARWGVRAFLARRARPRRTSLDAPTPSSQLPVAPPERIAPDSFDDAQRIADQLKRGLPVILDLQQVDAQLAKRHIDFAAGLVYAIDGHMERVAPRVFRLAQNRDQTPATSRLGAPLSNADGSGGACACTGRRCMTGNAAVYEDHGKPLLPYAITIGGDLPRVRHAADDPREHAGGDDRRGEPLTGLRLASLAAQPRGGSTSSGVIDRERRSPPSHDSSKIAARPRADARTRHDLHRPPQHSEPFARPARCTRAVQTQVRRNPEQGSSDRDRGWWGVPKGAAPPFRRRAHPRKCAAGWPAPVCGCRLPNLIRPPANGRAGAVKALGRGELLCSVNLAPREGWIGCEG